MTNLVRTETLGNVAINTEVRKRVQEALDIIERLCSVRTLLTADSGSRAWGFQSPDSDYDVFSLFARPRDWYHSINFRRNVIECLIAGTLDVTLSGWNNKG